MHLFGKLVLLCVAAILSHVVTGNTLHGGTCLAYTVMRLFEDVCEYERFQSPHLVYYKLEQEGTLTADDVVNHIERDCRHRRDGYMTCAQSLVTDCNWAEQGIMETMVTNNQDTLCQGNDVAPWIRQYMWRGFSFDHACYHHVTDVFNQCSVENPMYSLDVETSSLTMANWMYGLLISRMFSCTAEKLRRLPGPTGCTSSYVDQLFYLWVFRRNDQPIHKLTEDEISQLQTLKTEDILSAEETNYS